MARTHEQIKASAIHHGHGPKGAQVIANIVAPAEASAEHAARGLSTGDCVVCDVWHSRHEQRIGRVGDGMISFDGGILSNARVEILSLPFRFSRSADFHEQKRYGGFDENVCTLADGTKFILENPSGSCVWRDSDGKEVSIAAEALRRTPV